ncbi:MAG: FAD binding domain-containing protein [Oscillospiraceae bacterium]|nr:FAD binding domain-containing protein [Oscillospiraceae bacterium]
MMTIKNYVRAQSLEEAYTLNQSRRNKIIGGMVWMKMTSLNINTAIDLCDLGLDTIEETDTAFSIGCMATLRQLETHEGLNAYTCGAMKKAVQDIVGVQFRNCATVGGSVYGRFGFSDVLTVLLAMDCSVELYKGGIIPLEKFAAMMKDNDILVRIHIQKTPARFSYEAMRAQRTDFPVLTVAASTLGKLAVGARPMRAMVMPFSGDDIDTIAEQAANTIPTAKNLRGSKEYRTHLVKVLTKRALEGLYGN